MVVHGLSLADAYVQLKQSRAFSATEIKQVCCCAENSERESVRVTVRGDTMRQCFILDRPSCSTNTQLSRNKEFRCNVAGNNCSMERKAEYHSDLLMANRQI